MPGADDSPGRSAAEMSRPHLLAFGGAHVDRRGRVAGPFRPAASNPGTMHEDTGGGAFNALRTAVRRGVEGALVSLRGGDAAGEAVAAAIRRAGIADLSSVFLDRATPSYTAILDRDGELIAGLADMALYDLGFAKELRRRKNREAIAAADAVLCDANIPAEAIEKLALLTGDKPLFAIAVSPAKVVRLEGVLDRLACLFLNAQEARRLAGLDDEADIDAAVRRLCERGLRRGVVSAGGSSCTVFDRAGLRYRLRPPAVRRLVDVTGAGDALAGAAIAASMRGRPLAEAVREGLAAAMLAVESGTASPDFTEAEFEAALALVEEPETVPQDADERRP